MLKSAPPVGGWTLDRARLVEGQAVFVEGDLVTAVVEHAGQVVLLDVARAVQ